MLHNDLKVKASKILVLGIIFKKNFPNLQNTKMMDVVRELQQYETEVTICDPLANPAEVLDESINYQIHPSH